jgi:hypothetical protein
VLGCSWSRRGRMPRRFLTGWCAGRVCGPGKELPSSTFARQYRFEAPHEVRRDVDALPSLVMWLLAGWLFWVEGAVVVLSQWRIGLDWR